MQGPCHSRRGFLEAALGSGAFFLLPQIARAQSAAVAAGGTGPAEPFSYGILTEMARALAREPFAAMPVPDAAVIEQIDYDRHNQVRFRKEATLWADQGDVSPVQFFFPGRYFPEPVHIYTVEDGQAREVPFSLDMFDIPAGHPAQDLTHTEGFAGFKVMDPKTGLDWMAVLGASYWRTSGYSGQFGMSVRGLAVDTAIPNGPEEFPRFTRFWLEPMSDGGIVAYALMESPRVTGAYRIESHRDNGVIQDVDAKIFLRGDIERLGIAPLTSMFWFGKHNADVSPDWRPEVHDSDGLEIHSGSGERIWRPLNNPPHTMANAFMAPNVKGFGLMQRERDFARYQDDGVFYEKRASVWVEPKGDWGDGAVSLVEISTDDEIYDNIVASWQPAAPAVAGAEFDFAYRLYWMKDAPVEPVAARFLAVRIGEGGVPGQVRPENVVKVVCDLEGRGLEGLGRGDGVELNVSASRGTVTDEVVYPIATKDTWRAMFDLDFADIPAEDDAPIDLRLFVEYEGEAKTETLLLQLFPSQLRRILQSHA
ncbi:glucan biosynthesis protein [Tropicimonas sp. IMCC34043]|uniref:glucan biosynthesis protein n=1 Tax=Tropicimonas sp. IMCC34043 TaxID=2248760 RepID=UPI000E21EC9B|nr:glucan biosynthesis protein D [Tropicimonas sp. IMCC34043]